MKQTKWIAIIGIALIGWGCNSNTYSRMRDKEDKLIANYISRNQLNILTKEPADDYVWGEKDYYKMVGYDNFYFHLISRGDSIWVDSATNDTTDLSIIAGDKVVVRYKQFELTEYPDTLSYWSTLDQAYPYEFQYLNTTDCEATGWHLAVRLMKYPNSQCQIIQPSKLGFNSAQMSVTPYSFIMKIKVKQ
ncbi:MAG: DUF4827 family protein [Paludibacteraceae bacterium]|nr:DUF4827 family protein [Paludibacteraceae bacterium]